MGLTIGFFACGSAQGIKITYIEQTKAPNNLHELSAQMQETVKKRLQQQDKTMCLYACNGESLYAPMVSNTDTFAPNNGSVQILTMGGGGCIYKDSKNKQLISQEYIVDRKFLITEPLTTPIWTLIPDEKMIAGVICKKATDKGGNVAWYAPTIPIDAGPYAFFGLPGLILEIDTSSVTVVVQEINLKYDVSSVLKRPDSGKQITREAFNDLKKKKLEAMGVNGNTSGVKVITM